MVSSEDRHLKLRQRPQEDCSDLNLYKQTRLRGIQEEDCLDQMEEVAASEDPLQQDSAILEQVSAVLFNPTPSAIPNPTIQDFLEVANLNQEDCSVAISLSLEVEGSSGVVKVSLAVEDAYSLTALTEEVSSATINHMYLEVSLEVMLSQEEVLMETRLNLSLATPIHLVTLLLQSLEILNSTLVQV